MSDLFFQLKLTIYHGGPVFQMRGLVKGENLQDAVNRAMGRVGLGPANQWDRPAVKFLTRELVGGIVRDIPPGSNLGPPAGDPTAHLPWDVPNFARVIYELPGSNVHLEVFDLRYDPEGRIDRALFNAKVREAEGEEEEGEDYELEY